MNRSQSLAMPGRQRLRTAVGDVHYGKPRQETLTINADWFDHLLNCMCEQKYLHERGDSPTTRKDQKIIDDVYREAREIQHHPPAECAQVPRVSPTLKDRAHA